MKARTNKILSVILSVVLLGSIFSAFQAQPVSALTNFYMVVQPRKVATRSTYKFFVTIEEKLDVHEAITLVWPAGTIIDPPIPTDEKKRKERLTQIIESMSIGLSPCSACQGLPKITDTPDGGIQLVFNTHIELNPAIEGYSDIVVTVPDTCGFVTPPEEGEYIWKFSTGAEPTLVPSAPFMIVTSAIGVPEGMPEVEVKPASFRANAAYKIGFNVGRGGWLREGDGRIRVKFPEGTLFSKQEIKEKYILVNGKPLVNPPLAIRTQMTFITPVGVADGGRITIEIAEGAGIVNPAKPGEYKLQVSTVPADKLWVESTPYLIEKGGALLKIVPSKVNKKAQYSFSFILESEKSLTSGGKMNVKFPEGTNVPTTLDKSKITIGGEEVSAIAVNGMEVELTSAVSFDKEGTVDVLFNAETGIVNSKKAGEVKLGYKLESDEDYLLTTAVELIESRLEIVDVINEPNNAHSISQWTIDGMVGDNGALKKGDFIALTFPENVEMPEQISAETVTINGEAISKATIKGQTVEFSLTKPIAGGETFKLVATLDAGIRNPNEDKVGYTLSVYTSVEKDPALTPTFFTTPALPEAKYKIFGGEKGENGWYLKPPMVNFTCNDPNAVIKLYWDDKDNQIITFGGEPKPLDIGQYESRITYWAESITGSEPSKSFVVKVDTLPPEVVMISPEELKTITTEATIKVEGRTTLLTTIRFGVDSLEYDLIAFINGEEVTVNPEDGNFSKMVDLKNGLNKINVLAKDEAGHKKELNYEVMYDIEPPAIEVTYPKEDEVVTKKRFEVTGKTDPTAQLTIDGEFVYLEEDGSFAYEMTPRKLGKLTLELIATDPVGNVTTKKINFTFGYTIILAIGKNIATVNGVDVKLSMTPIIQNGRTLVPFGFIGRALAAKVGFTRHAVTNNVDTVWLELDGTKVILTIGSKIAKVNGKDMEMDVACQIISGNTMVPVRFVTDSLGAEIGWEGKSQTITITYPKVK